MCCLFHTQGCRAQSGPDAQCLIMVWRAARSARLLQLSALALTRFARCLAMAQDELTNNTLIACVFSCCYRGGGIELSILSKHYGRVIAAYDIQTKRCDRCGRL